MKKTITTAIFFLLILEAATALPGSTLNREDAMKKALKDAGVTADQVTIHTMETERDHGEVFYELEFSDNQNHYFYAIQGNGQILKRSIDRMHETNVTEPSGSYISASEAKTISLRISGWAQSETRFEKLELDQKHGRMIYEVEMEKGKDKYEIELDAVSGDIIKMERN